MTSWFVVVTPNARIALTCALTCLLNAMLTAQQPELIGVQELPEIKIGGERVQVHTQGLYVNDRDFIVTGRVDTPPRRPVVIRFSRADLSTYQILDLSPIDSGKQGLNHPGGFDRDEQGRYWIPVSTSHRRGPTKIVAMRLDAGKLPSEVSQISHAHEFPDHIGAIACLGNGRLLAANWDTKTIYLIDSSTGKLEDEIPHDRFFGGAERIQLAVQDWKYDRAAKHLIAGGIDKSGGRKPEQSPAVVAWIDPESHQTTKLTRLKSRSDVARPLTNEGLSVHNGDLFLLPEDIGRGAKILRMSIVKAE